MNEWILLRGHRKEYPEFMEIKMVRAEDTDLTGYSFLVAREKYDEWVPTEELQKYQRVMHLWNK